MATRITSIKIGAVNVTKVMVKHTGQPDSAYVTVYPAGTVTFRYNMWKQGIITEESAGFTLQVYSISSPIDVRVTARNGFDWIVENVSAPSQWTPMPSPIQFSPYTFYARGHGAVDWTLITTISAENDKERDKMASCKGAEAIIVQ